MTKTAFITGASSGIGLASAKIFALNGYNLILCGRRKEKLQMLKKELSNVSIHILCFDVSKEQEVNSAIASLPPYYKDIDILLNNAGNAHGLDYFQDAHLEDWEMMIDTNLKGLLYVSRNIIPLMLQKNEGHIINIGSIAGKEVYPKGNVYCATKHAVDALTEGMRMDLIDKGIKVSAINPGLVETEFSEVRFKGDIQRAKQVYKGMEPLTPEDIAEIILFVVTRPSRVNIADLTVLAGTQASATIVSRK
jgi:3-hydroxy acid dehydrogenase/malonic semialdehyde reductase